MKLVDERERERERGNANSKDEKSTPDGPQE